MSTEHTNGHADNGRPVHTDVSYEARDVRTSPILKFLVYLGISVVISYGIALGVYRGLIRFWTDQYPQPIPARLEAGPVRPPEPMLQGMPGHPIDPQQDLRNKINADTEANNELGWVDKGRGIAQIPVRDAMQLIVEKGFPAIAAPPAEKK